MNYYNDNEPFVVKWLKELVRAELIPGGDVDDRPIQEIKPGELEKYTQCHFFAGIGGWPYALGLSGWNADRPVWTGSCPCQPLSCAGKGLGEKDERHLWPVWFELISELRPPEIFGEQVASGDGREWLAGVRTDLEALGYAVGAADLPAASVGAPHKRNRLFWMADSQQQGLEGHAGDGNGRDEPGRIGKKTGGSVAEGGASDRLAATERNGGRSNQQERKTQERATNFWHSSVFIQCADGKARRVPGRVAQSVDAGSPPKQARQLYGRKTRSSTTDTISSSSRSKTKLSIEIEPLLFPLVDGFQNRVGALRGAGNAIVPQVAAEFIGAYMEMRGRVVYYRGEL